MNKYIIKWHIVISASKKLKKQWKGIDTKIRIKYGSHPQWAHDLDSKTCLKYVES